MGIIRAKLVYYIVFDGDDANLLISTLRKISNYGEAFIYLFLRSLYTIYI